MRLPNFYICSDVQNQDKREKYLSRYLLYDEKATKKNEENFHSFVPLLLLIYMPVFSGLKKFVPSIFRTQKACTKHFSMLLYFGKDINLILREKEQYEFKPLCFKCL